MENKISYDTIKKNKTLEGYFKTDKVQKKAEEEEN